MSANSDVNTVNFECVKSADDIATESSTKYFAVIQPVHREIACIGLLNMLKPVTFPDFDLKTLLRR